MNRNEIILCTILSVIMLLMSTIFFMSGFHNLDYGHNLHWLQEKFNITVYDTAHNGLGQSMDMYSEELVISGAAMIRMGFIGGIFSSILFGILVWMLKKS